ncbi:MAG TPA: MoaD/ThiS family protein [Gaiella sp.]|jgi:molybdopterin converting factor small subunit
MARVRLRAPLSELTGGSDHEIAGATVLELLEALERAHPAMAGWVLDEQRRIRVHVNVYVNGQPAGEDAAVAASDRVHVLPSITGGEL